MATVGGTFVMGDMQDDGPIAVRDFPVGCGRRPRSVGKIPVESSKRQRSVGMTPVESRKRQRGLGKIPVESSECRRKSPRCMLSDDFHSLSDRQRFLERRRIFTQLLMLYQGNKARPDLAAMGDMSKHKLSFQYQGLGHVPGVNVGDKFDYRAEIYVVGLHQVDQAGIACVNYRGKMIASSVVVSGGYQDVDCGEIIEYTGHGGKDYKGDNRPKKDQELKGGNKALFNSFKSKTVVRVIRGRSVGTPSNTKYSYDGLYTVISCDLVKGIDGYKVYKFKLQRSN